MGLFGFRKKGTVLDLSKRYREQQKQSKELANKGSIPYQPSKREVSLVNSQETQVQTEEKHAAPFFPFFDSSTKQEEKPEVVDIESIEERKKKLAKRLMDITNKLEDISNQLYHLAQRVEVLEKRTKVNNFE